MCKKIYEQEVDNGLFIYLKKKKYKRVRLM